MDIKKIKKNIKSNLWTKNLIYLPYLLCKRITKIIFLIAISLTFIIFFITSSYLFFKKKIKKSVLFLVEGDPKKGLSPATRFRVYQYIDYFEKDGFHCKISPSIPYKYFNAQFRFRNLKKDLPLLASLVIGIGLMRMILNRIRDLIISRSFDIVFIQRDLLPIPNPLLEKCIKRINHRIIFDFDDAIFLKPSWCKRNPHETLSDYRMRKKVSKIIAFSSWVIAANEYLGSFAKKINSKVSVIPTPIDIHRYIPLAKRKKKEINIGWVGTSGNLYYLNGLMSVFENLFERFSQLRLKVICDFVTKEEYHILKHPQVIFKEWSIHEELKNLRSIDIGIMPLADDEWAQGKAGFKIIQFMSLGIPVVASPVGFNRQIITNHINGFFAKSSQEWIRKLSMLIKDKKLRKKIGDKGRQFVERNYSVEVTYPKLSKIFKEILKS